MAKKINKTLVVRAVISKIKDDRAPDKIEVKELEGFDTPDKIPSNVKDDGLIPDVAVHYGKVLNIYEIELEDTMDAEKWKLMSLYLKKNKGHLFLVVPDYLKEKIKGELEKSKINAGLIYFNTE